MITIICRIKIPDFLLNRIHHNSHNLSKLMMDLQNGMSNTSQKILTLLLV